MVNNMVFIIIIADYGVQNSNATVEKARFYLIYDVCD